MAEIIKLPRMSDTMTEGKIVSWQKKIGDKIKSGDILAEIETDKATMELESYSNGILLYIANEKGSVVAVDSIIAVIGKEGEDYKSLINESKNQNINTDSNTKLKDSNIILSTTTNNDKIDLTKAGVNIIRMPLLSDTMKEGKIIKWNKKIGDKVKSDDNIADVETDKATMEIIAYAEGTLLHIGVKEGENAAINNVIAIIGKADADIEKILTQLNNETQTIATNIINVEKKENDSTKNNNSSNTISTNNNTRIKISPLAKKLANNKGIEISTITGSGENGRIIKIDIDNYTPQKTSKQTTNIKSFGYEDIELTQMRKTIAKRLCESKFNAPHFYLTMSINMDNAVESRKKLNEIGLSKISFNDLVIKAVAIALKKHPNINSSWLGDKIRINYDVNIGIAVAIPDGLLVPVLRNADLKSLTEINTEVKNFAQKAKDKQLQPKDWEGNTFTISNLGMYGIDDFTAIINPPDSCILAVGGIKQEAIVKNGQIVIGNTMKITLSCDHRVVDGAMAALFLQTLKNYLEEPLSIIL